MQNGALPNGINGGMTIYYTQQDFNANGNQKITAFKPVSLNTEGGHIYIVLQTKEDAAQSSLESH